MQRPDESSELTQGDGRRPVQLWMMNDDGVHMGYLATLQTHH